MRPKATCAMTTGALTRSRPRGIEAPSTTASPASEISESGPAVRSCSARPSSVSRKLRDPRSISRTPRLRSSSATRRDSVALERPETRLALPKPPLAATRLKSERACRSIEMFRIWDELFRSWYLLREIGTSIFLVLADETPQFTEGITDMSILVTGSTGTIGTQVLSYLQGRGVEVRALTRSPDAAKLPSGVAPVRGDLADVDTLRAALEGVSTLFLLAPNVADELTQAMLALTTAGEAGVKGIVYLSVLKGEAYA